MPLAIDGDLAAAKDVWLTYFPYRATLLKLNSSIDNYGGSAPSTPTTMASNLPMFYESLRNPITKEVGDKVTIVGTHRLYFEATATTTLIDTTYEIHINAYLNESAKVFVRPVIFEAAFGHIVQVAAVLQ